MNENQRYYRRHPEAVKKKNKVWRKANPEACVPSKETARRGHLRRNYNLTLEEWEDLFNSQGRACAICKTTEPLGGKWHTDHNHKTGKVAGILCPPCNHLLGNAKDDSEILRTAAAYNDAKQAA